MPHYLPWPDYATLHKTGDGTPALAHDVGIILGPDNLKLVIAFFSAAIAEPYAERGPHRAPWREPWSTTGC